MTVKQLSKNTYNQIAPFGPIIINQSNTEEKQLLLEILVWYTFGIQCFREAWKQAVNNSTCLLDRHSVMAGSVAVCPQRFIFYNVSVL